MKRNLIETLMGAVVLIIAAFFVVTTYQSSGINKTYDYQISALFDSVDGITPGSDVRIGGIKIGTVVEQSLDEKSFRAKLTLGLDGKVKLPVDSSAVVASDGLLGSKYVNIVPGSDDQLLKNGGAIQYTQSSVNLEQLIGKFAFGSAGGGDKAAAAKTDSTASAAGKAATPSLLDDSKPQPKAK